MAEVARSTTGSSESEDSSDMEVVSENISSIANINPNKRNINKITSPNSIAVNEKAKKMAEDPSPILFFDLSKDQRSRAFLLHEFKSANL